ncbi:hypothetical protein QR676_04120 [Vibrio sp. TMPB1044]|uniref:hypothetical protein n=1 Tax=Vibrio sp. TMPB1044 TaxID=3051822 RepID=UPI00255BE94C|nr:hypothetical protein [Vibrio sp. TMPB1044]MDL5026405.1 hypothetical protein [Vibrio sp. TMPB1044]MDN5206533.1 hypothetical protein [Vibrio sp. TMPB1044]
MITDVKGKVKNLKLSPAERLIPVLEAVVNSIQACSGNKARLELEILRQTTQTTLDADSDKYQEIESFRVIDQGVGFTDENLTSFRTADSTYKAQLGCKGVGRFTWLKVFESVSVDSVYKKDNEFYDIKFDFSIDNSDIDTVKANPSDRNKIQTVVTLTNIKSPYQKKLPTDISEIADEILEHCLMYFLEDKIESFILKSNTNESINLIDYFNANFDSDVKKTKFKSGSQNFKAYYFRNYGRQRIHKINFCANSRTVSTYKPTDFLPNIPAYFQDDQGKRFRYSIFVSSPYFDENVTQERTNLAIAKADELLDDEHPSIDAIIGELIIDCDGVFNEYFQPMLVQHRERVQEFVDTKGYEYRHVLKHRPEWIDLIKIGLAEEQLDIELHKLSRDFETDLKTEAIQIKKSLKESKSISSEEYKEAYKRYTSEINDIGKSNLAKYIVHRKSIIDIFELNLELQNTEKKKYHLENTIHDVILPLSSTSDDITNLSQNLWLIDERMSYHALLSSDKSFESVTDIDSRERPDVMLFNNPIAFCDDKDEPRTATIIEFKRPMRDDYDDNENPVKQTLGYAKKLRDRDYVNAKGRNLYLAKGVPIYCYIICDLTKSIREYCADNNYTPTTDNNGYIWYHRDYNIYFEILSFKKVLLDAKKRNTSLFRMLNLQ